MAEANAGKALTVEIDGTSFSRIPIRTRVVMPGDDLDAFVREYATDVVQPGDLLFVTEKIVAITQGRSYLVDDDQAAQARAVPVEVRDAHAVRHRPRHARDDGDGAARVRNAAHPVRRRRLGGHQGLRPQGRLLPHRRRQGPRDRRPDERHDPAVQQGRRARTRATARGRAAPEGAARRSAPRSPSSTSTTWAATSSARRSTRPARSASSRS